MQTQTQSTQATMTPQDALAHLRNGNARFLASRQEERNLLEQVKVTGDGQYPFAVVLSCIDSRVAPELIFDQGIGDIFTVRIAGNFVNRDILGSMEFACKVAGAKLILVLGHTRCGAIMGACDGVQLGNLTEMLTKLQPAVEAVTTTTDETQRNSQNPTFVQQVAEKNVALTMNAIQAQSPLLREMITSGDIQIAGAMYDVETGEVEIW